MYTLEEGPNIIVQVPERIEPHTIQDMKTECPKEIPGAHKSSRVKFQTKQEYTPIMTGSKYTVAVAHLEDDGTLHLDAHMFFMKMQEEHPDTVSAIMTKLLLTSGLKNGG